LMRHKDLILKKAADYKKLSKVAAKFLWIATYHNNVIRGIGAEQFATRGLVMDDFLITNEELAIVVEL